MFVKLVRNMFSVVAGASVRETWQLQSVAESTMMYSFRTMDIAAHQCYIMSMRIDHHQMATYHYIIIRKLPGSVYSMQWELYCCTRDLTKQDLTFLP